MKLHYHQIPRRIYSQIRKARAAKTGRPIPSLTPRATFRVEVSPEEEEAGGGVSMAVELGIEDIVFIIEEGE